MVKKDNKGFTLLELLISIFILTIVIFIGYRIIDKVTIDIKNQGNINQGQMTMNNMNEYLTKDLEQSKSVLLFINNDITPEEDLDKIDQDFNSLISNEPAKYKYIINPDDRPNSVFYEIFISYKNNKYRYSITRTDSANIKIEFVNEEILEDTSKAPFTIKGENPYEVSIQYNGKGGKVVRHKFEVTSRYQIDSNKWDGETEIEPSFHNEDSIVISNDVGDKYVWFLTRIVW